MDKWELKKMSPISFVENEIIMSTSSQRHLFFGKRLNCQQRHEDPFVLNLYRDMNMNKLSTQFFA